MLRLLAGCLGLWAIATLVLRGASVALLLLGRGGEPARAGRHATITVLLPVSHLDIGFERCLRSLYEARLPEDSVARVLVVSADPEGAAARLAMEIAADYPTTETALVACPRTTFASPKLNLIADALPRIESDLVLVKDSNVALAPDDLLSLLGAIGPRTGIVFAPPLAVEGTGFAAELERAFLNQYHLPIIVAAGRIGQGRAVGKLFAFRRMPFIAAGGPSAVADTIAEDHAMTKLMKRSGWMTAVAPVAARQPLGRTSLTKVLARQLRWAICRREVEPLLLFLELLTGNVAGLLAAAAGAALLGLPVWAALLAYAAAWTLSELFARQALPPEARASLLAAALRDLLVPWLVVAGLTAAEVRWRDSTIPVGPRRRAAARMRCDRADG